MTQAATTAGIIRRMAMRRTHMVSAGAGEMAGAIVPASTFTIRGKTIGAAAAITRRSTTVAAEASTLASASTAVVVVAVMAVVAIAEIFLIAGKNERRRIAIRSVAVFSSSLLPRQKDAYHGTSCGFCISQLILKYCNSVPSEWASASLAFSRSTSACTWLPSALTSSSL